MVLVIEHGSSRSGRWLRRHRLRLAVWIAAIEGILVLLRVVPLTAALLVAAAVIGLFLLVGRKLRTEGAYQLSWVAAVSQLLVAAIPIFLAVVTLAAFAAVAILVLGALLLLAARRR